MTEILCAVCGTTGTNYGYCKLCRGTGHARGAHCGLCRGHGEVLRCRTPGCATAPQPTPGGGTLDLPEWLTGADPQPPREGVEPGDGLAEERARSRARWGRRSTAGGEHRFEGERCELCGVLEMLARPFGWTCAPALHAG